MSMDVTATIICNICGRKIIVQRGPGWPVDTQGECRQRAGFHGWTHNEAGQDFCPSCTKGQAATDEANPENGTDWRAYLMRYSFEDEMYALLIDSRGIIGAVLGPLDPSDYNTLEGSKQTIRTLFSVDAATEDVEWARREEKAHRFAMVSRLRWAA